MPLQPASDRVARRVVLFIVDGLRADAAHDLAALDRLRQRGASRVLHIGFPSVSIPQYYAALSGVEPDLSGARTNGFRWMEWRLDTIVGRARQAGLRVATLGPNDPWFQPGFGEQFSHAWFGDSDYDENLSRVLALSSDLTVIVHDAVDVAGHDHGFGDAYRQAARVADAAIARVASSLDLERDVLFVTADHGHCDAGGHGGDEPEVMAVPLVAAGAGIRPGHYGEARLVDLAPTLAALLGLPPPVTSRGLPLADMLSLSTRAARRLVVESRDHRQVLDRLLGDRLAPITDRLRAEQTARLLALPLLLGAFALILARLGVGHRELACALAYLAAFVGVFWLCGGRVSLSSPRTSGYFARILVCAFLVAGPVYLALARRARRGSSVRGLLSRVHAPTLCTASLAALPWLVTLAVVGVRAEVLLPAPTWTALGAWSGIPLICFAPWAVVDVVALGLATGGWRGAG